MNNYFFEKDKNKIKGVRQADIFKEIIHKSQGYKPNYYFATTFGLNLGRVINLLYDVSFDILKNGRFDIYYDRFKASNSFSGKINDTDISGAFMGRIHSVKIDRNFHPKLQILRLKNSDNDIMYAVTVSSKNLTSDDSAEVYAVLTGSPAKDKSKQNNKKPNGKALKAFLKDFVNANKCADPNTVKDMLDEIGKTEFTLYNSSEEAEVCFLPQTAVFSKIQKLSELVIVTPFISSNAVNKIGNDKIKMIVVRNELIDDKVENNTNGSADKTSAENTADSNTPAEGTATEASKSGSSKYKHTDIRDIWNESIKFYSMTNLHGKIYCGRTGDKTALIIGSSNCTASGLGIVLKKNSKCNRELNVMITFKDEKSEFYKSFFNSLASNCTQLTKKITESDCIKNDDDAKEKRRNLGSIIEEVSFGKGEYTVKINVENIKKSDIENVKINTTLIYDKNDVENCQKEACFSTEHISVFINDVKINDIFLPDMVGNNDKVYEDHIQTVKSATINELRTHFEQYIMCGRKSIQLSTNSNEQSPNEDKEKSNNTPASSLSYKDELYERLLKYATLIDDRKIFKERLERLYDEAYSNSDNREAKLLEMILGISKDKNEEKK